MKIVESILEPINGYLLTMNRNTVEGWYELEVGIPSTWVFDENEEIGIEVISKNEEGKFLKIFPKNSNIVIDDLFLFTKIIVDTNKKIGEKEEEFKKQLKKMKEDIENSAKDYFKQLDELKENSFKKLNDNFVAELNNGEKGEKKEMRGRKPKIKTISGMTETNTTNIVKSKK